MYQVLSKSSSSRFMSSHHLLGILPQQLGRLERVTRCVSTSRRRINALQNNSVREDLATIMIRVAIHMRIRFISDDLFTKELSSLTSYKL